MTKKQIFSTTYFLSGTLFLGFGYSIMINVANYDAWISAILGLLIGCSFVALIGYINKQKGPDKLYDYLKNAKTFGFIMRILLIIVSAFMFILILANLEIFTSSFFFVHTPNYMVALPVIILMIIFAKNGLKCVGRVAEILFIISLPIIIFICTAFIQYIDLDNIKPIMMASNNQIALSTLFFAIFSATPYLLLLNTEDDGKYYVLGYIFTAFVSIIILFIIISVLGPTLMHLYQYPEYFVLKKFKVFGFLERIENIVSIIWIFNCIITLACSSVMIKDLFPKKGQNITFPIFTIILFLISTYTINHSAIFHSYSKYVPYPLLIGFFIIVIPLSIYSFKKNKEHKKMKEN